MLGWFFYEEAEEETPQQQQLQQQQRGIQGGIDDTRERGRLQGTAPASASYAGGASEADVNPTFDDLDPVVTAAILTQAAFRGYRLRERLRGLPAREAERAIRGLHRNTMGFRRLALFLAFFGLYFALVFSMLDVSFQRSVEQGLRDHVALVKYGPENDRTHNDVSSMADLHQWMQAFYLRTYSGTQLEHRCSPCIVKQQVTEEICDACDFSDYDAEVGAATGDNRRRTASASSSSSSSSTNVFGLSELCRRCLVARRCEGIYLENCIDFLVSSSEDNGVSDGDTGTTSAESDWALSPNVSAALAEIDLEPQGGVSALAGYLAVSNVSNCTSFIEDFGRTENMHRFDLSLEVPYNGIGYLAERNRIIGGMLVTFTRRSLLSLEECKSSRDYYDVCLSEDQDKDTIEINGTLTNFRPDQNVVYNSEAGGFPILIDTGGFNTGLNFGYCTLLTMEEVNLIPRDEVKSVSVQVVTYNGNEKSTYGSIWIDFDFEDGGEVLVDEEFTAYLLQGVGDSNATLQWFGGLVFSVVFIGMARHDTRKWYRTRHSKVKRNRCHCLCGLTFHVLVFTNILMWLAWGFLGSSVTFVTEFQNVEGSSQVLDSLTNEVVTLHQIALLADFTTFLFLLTTMAGLYRWIFQMLTFHKRMSIVTDTLSGASTHLDHFLFVFFLVMMVFANITWLLVGSTAEEFSTLPDSWRSVLRVSLGESENFYPQILEAQPTVGPVMVVMYQVLGVVLLLNVVIAVILEAYREVVGGMRGEDTIFQSLTAFVGMTLCMWAVRLRWTCSYVRWRLSGRRNEAGGRPSLKVALQGSTGVCGVDGRPVLMIRRPAHKVSMTAERQLSFNCPRYISVTEMQALIEATPVPSFVADRIVRKIVHEWVFHSDEKRTGTSAPGMFSGGASFSGGYGRSGSESIEPLPMLRRPDAPSTSR